MRRDALALEAFTGRQVVIFNGDKYYEVGSMGRLGARGRLSFFEYDSSTTMSPLGHINLKRWSDPIGQGRRLPADSILGGDGDVWFTEAQRYPGPKTIYSNDYVTETTFDEVFRYLRADTFVLDWRLVMYARGREGGGRGKKAREAAVHRKVMWDGDARTPEIVEYDVTGVNVNGDYDKRGEWIPGRPYLDHKKYNGFDKIWCAGSTWFFTDEEEARAASEDGLIGRMPTPKRVLSEKFQRSVSDGLREMIGKENLQTIGGQTEYAEKLKAIFEAAAVPPQAYTDTREVDAEYRSRVRRVYNDPGKRFDLDALLENSSSSTSTTDSPADSSSSSSKSSDRHDDKPSAKTDHAKTGHVSGRKSDHKSD